MTDRQPDAAPSPREINAGDDFRNTMLPRMDSVSDGGYPLWHGWVIMDSFLAGVAWQRSEPSAPSRDAVLDWAIPLVNFEAAQQLRALKAAPQVVLSGASSELPGASSATGTGEPAAAAPAPKGNAELVSRAADTLRAQDQQEVGGIQVLTIDFWRARAVYLAEGVLRKAANALERTD